MHRVNTQGPGFSQIVSVLHLGGCLFQDHPGPEAVTQHKVPQKPKKSLFMWDSPVFFRTLFQPVFWRCWFLSGFCCWKFKKSQKLSLERKISWGFTLVLTTQSTLTYIQISVRFVCDHTLTLSNRETCCYAFGIVGKPWTRWCAWWSCHKFQTNGATFYICGYLLELGQEIWRFFLNFGLILGYWKI